MTLVRIRCTHCRSILTEIDEPPADWSGFFTFTRCRKCDVPSPGRIVKVLLASGQDGFAIRAQVPWSQLRPAIEKAWRRGKPVDFTVNVVDDEPDSQV